MIGKSGHESWALNCFKTPDSGATSSSFWNNDTQFTSVFTSLQCPVGAWSLKQNVFFYMESAQFVWKLFPIGPKKNKIYKSPIFAKCLEKSPENWTHHKTYWRLETTVTFTKKRKFLFDKSQTRNATIHSHGKVLPQTGNHFRLFM